CPSSPSRDHGGWCRPRAARASGVAARARRHRLVATAQLLPRLTGGRLLGLLLRPALPGATRQAVDVNRREEVLGVIGTLVDHVVARQLVEDARGQLLETGLVVLAAGAGGGFGDAVPEQPHHELDGRGPPARQV